MLEVIDKGSCCDDHPTPLLFVHGGWHAAWCWDEHFLDFFADRGFRAVAVSLRGHGRSTSSKPLRSCSVADYVDDVHHAAEGLGGGPVVIGHSVGGFVVQKYLEKHHAPAAVLLGSMPSQALRRVAVTFRIMRRHPAATIRSATVGTSADLVNTPRLARDLLFCADTPESIVESCAARLQDESDNANGLLVRAKPAQVTTPLLILGAEHDCAVSKGEVRATARAHGTQAEFFPMGHNMMLEPRWPDVAERIHNWLGGQGL